MNDPERLREYDNRDEIDERLAKIVSRVVRDSEVGVSYSEGGGNGEKSLLKWLVGLATSLLIISIVGLVGMYGKLSAIEANQANQQRQLDQLAGQVATLRRGP
jgi:hypothetical protein